MLIKRTKFRRALKRTREQRKQVPIHALHPGDKFTVVGVDMGGWLVHANICRARVRLDPKATMSDSDYRQPTYLDISPNTPVYKEDKC